MALPAFEDEGSQLRGAWRLLEAGEWLQPLGDGKPLEAWLMAPLLWLAPQPLAAIRALHVLVGMIGALLMWRLALQFYERWTAFLCGALFALCPFVVYLERLALADIFLCTAGIWVLLCTLELIQSPNGARTAALATALVLAAFCKLPVGFFFMASMPFALLMLPSRERSELLKRPVLTKVLLAYAPALLLMMVVCVVAVIRLRHGESPGFGLQDLAGVGMGQYQGIAAVIGLPRPNLIDELTAQLSWPVAVIALIGVAVGAFSRDWRLRWLIVVGALPMLGIGLLAKFWYSRYLLFTLPPLLMGAVAGWRSLVRQVPAFRLPLELTVLAVCVGLMGYQSARLILDPAAARWSALDRFQYFEGWGSGYGFPEAAQFVLAAPTAPATIFSLDGHSAYQLRTYLPSEWGSRIRPIIYGADGNVLRSEPGRLENLLSRSPTWIIISEQLLQVYLDSMFGHVNSGKLNLRQIAVFDKPGSRARLAIYEVNRSADCVTSACNP